MSLHRSNVEPAPSDRPCSWCGAGITIIHRAGRPRLYCNHTCRQRAYEHRHGFRHERTVLPLPGQHRNDTWAGSGYEQGGAPILGGRSHALRTSVRPEGRRRETLCGALARPLPGRYFSAGQPGACKTCAEVSTRAPLTFGVSASNELSRLRAIIVEGLERRLHADALVRWLATERAVSPSSLDG